MKTFILELHTPEGSKPTVKFPKQVINAEELGPMISALGDFRAHAAEPVPADLPDGHLVLGLDVQPLEGCEVARDLEGTVLVVRDGRFGWLAYRMTHATRAWLITALMDEEQAAQRAAQADKGSAH